MIRSEGIQLRMLLSKKAIEPGANKELIKSLMSIVSSIEMAVTGLESMLQHVRAKISERLLFSEKALAIKQWTRFVVSSKKHLMS